MNNNYRRKKPKRGHRSPSSPSSLMKNAAATTAICDLSPFVHFFFICLLLCSDSYVFSLGFNQHRRETLLESLLPSTKPKLSSLCKLRDFECTNQALQSLPNPKEIPPNPQIVINGTRNITIQSNKPNATAPGPTAKIAPRLEPGGEHYNYASSSKGAKVLAHNKEAKGPSNILEKDNDKYLRNPCSAEGKFIVVELAEETLVDSFSIANLEHYSSNFKDFELLGSLTYPTVNWTSLGNFTAQNARHAQRFTLPEPKWVRYMRLRLVSHYGSEFYCTLSFLEVYGVDAIEKMLEDFIVPGVNSSEPVKESEVGGEKVDAVEVKREVMTNQNKEVRQQAGRVPSDAVLKILMQKSRALEVGVSVLEEFTRELERRFGKAVPEIEREVEESGEVMERIGYEVDALMEAKSVMEKGIREIEEWKLNVSTQLEELVRDNVVLRENAEKIIKNQENLENKELIVVILSSFFACFALFKLTCDRIPKPFRTCDSGNVNRTSGGWLLLFISSSMATFITLLYS